MCEGQGLSWIRPLTICIYDHTQNVFTQQMPKIFHEPTYNRLIPFLFWTSHTLEYTFSFGITNQTDRKKKKQEMRERISDKKNPYRMKLYIPHTKHGYKNETEILNEINTTNYFFSK